MTIRIDGTNTTANPGITGADADTGLQFGTNEIELVTGGNNRVTVQNNGDLTIQDGNLIVASGHGISFVATANGPGPVVGELFDDYEEGTWTPTIAGGTTAGTASYNYQNGSYEKIGRQVTVRGFVDWTSATGTGSLQIEGLPYAATSTSLDYIQPGSIMIGDMTFPAGRTMATAYMPNGASYINVFMSGSNVVYAAESLEASGKLIFSVTYSTDS